MKRLLKTIVKTLSISLCITAIIIPQASQQYTKTIVNGKEKWKLNKQSHSSFDEKEQQQQQSDPQSFFHQKTNSSPGNLFDDRWSLQQPYPTDAFLLAVEADNDFIISTGLSGLFSTPYSELIISYDRGKTWSLKRFNSDSLISSIDKYENLIWLGGLENTNNNGFILKSSDLGNTWYEKLTIDSLGVLYVNFFDENYGVAITPLGDSDSTLLKIFHTTDGGDSWTSKLFTYEGRTPGLNGYHFSNPNYGWVCIKNIYPSDICRIMNTADGGSTWNLQLTDTLDNLDLIKFYDSNYGWAIGQQSNGTIRKLLLFSTKNGGSDWTGQTLLEGQNGSFRYDMFIQDSVNVWLAVSDNQGLTIYKSNDGFVSSNELSFIDGINFLFGDIQFISDSVGWIVSPLGKILYTSDGGYSWNPKHKSTTSKNLYSLDFIDENLGWAASRSGIGNENVIIKTNNAGVDWEIVYSDTTVDYFDLDFVSEQRGFLISDYSPDCTILRTEDGGFNWDSTQFVYAELNSIKFTDIYNGWAVGGNVSGLFIVHTSNSGDSWIQQNNINLLANSLNNVDFTNSVYGFAVGDDGVLIKTTDGGTSWNVAWGNLDPNLFWINYDLTGVYQSNPLTCWVSGYILTSDGYRTMVVNTTDGGANWDTLSFPSDYSISGDIFFINESDGLSVGNSNDYKTTDGGITWSRIEYPSDINKMFFLNAGLGWAAGNNGRIYNYYDPNVGVEGEKDLQFPNNYVLMQNYPNPFNPSTKISWQVPAGSHQTLNIYDVLGSEVAMLVNEYKPAGSYEVEWNATGLPSGIYFYQLRTENFIQTKKMILLK